MNRTTQWLRPIMFLALVLFPGAARPDELAPQGAKGNLTISVTVKGEGRLESGKAVYDSTAWKALHTLTYNVPVTAQNSMTLQDAGAMEALQGPGPSAEDEAIQAEWDKKLDDCDGDEDCESSIMAAMIADPGYQNMAAKLQNVAPDLVNVMRQVMLGSDHQLWLPAAGQGKSSYGVCTVEREDWTYGVIESAGGKSNDHSRRKGEMPIGSGPDDLSFSATVTIDKQAMTYEVKFDSDFVVRVEREEEADGEWREAGAPVTVPFFGNAPGSAGWSSDLTLTGIIESVGHPNFEGKKTIKSNFGDAKDPHYTFPVTITIEWKFESGT